MMFITTTWQFVPIQMPADRGVKAFRQSRALSSSTARCVKIQIAIVFRVVFDAKAIRGGFWVRQPFSFVDAVSLGRATETVIDGRAGLFSSSGTVPYKRPESCYCKDFSPHRRTESLCRWIFRTNVAEFILLTNLERCSKKLRCISNSCAGFWSCSPFPRNSSWHHHRWGSHTKRDSVKNFLVRAYHHPGHDLLGRLGLITWISDHMLFSQMQCVGWHGSTYSIMTSPPRPVCKLNWGYRRLSIDGMMYNVLFKGRIEETNLNVDPRIPLRFLRNKILICELFDLKNGSRTRNEAGGVKTDFLRQCSPNVIRPCF